MLTPDQFEKLLDALQMIAAGKTYTITGAADWPILVVLGAVIVAIIGLMWRDLKTTMKDGRAEWREEAKLIRAEIDKQVDHLWDAQRQCQSECCPRKTKIDG